MSIEAVLSFIADNRERYEAELGEFLRIPSISTAAEHSADMEKAAAFVAGQLKSAGIETVQVWPTAGHPIVLARSARQAGLPTVLVYGHYDVQPVDPVELWTTPPFEPNFREGRVYARGASDDKGQVLVHLKSAEALRKILGAYPVNLVFLIEGEEEIGSPNLDEFIRTHVNDLSCDVVLISDTSMFAQGVPSICAGLRGLAYFEIQVRGPKGDLHSGSFGGPVQNPAAALVEMLAAMRDREGRITIPGFYDDVVPLTERERAEWASLPFDVEAFKRELDVEALGGEQGYSPLELLWGRPTLEINGLLSGFTGEGAKTVLPARAMAKVSMRLVPDQDPVRIEKIFREYVAKIAPRSVKVEVTNLHGGYPWVASLDHPALLAAVEAIEQGFGRKPLFQREGGSIPIVRTFSDMLGVPSVLMGFGLPDENAHAPNEWFDLGNFHGGIRSSALFLNALPKHLPGR